MRHDMPERIARRESRVQMGGIGIPGDGGEQLDVIVSDDPDQRGAFADRDFVEGPVREKFLIHGSPLQHIGSGRIAEWLAAASCATKFRRCDPLGRG